MAPEAQGPGASSLVLSTFTNVRRLLSSRRSLSECGHEFVGRAQTRRAGSFCSQKRMLEVPGKERAVIRKLILSAAIAATLISLVAVPSRAAADPPTVLPHHRFEVLAERGGTWQSHGVFQLRARAELLAVRLRHQGYRVEIRQF
jgi:hypothetical protein